MPPNANKKVPLSPNHMGVCLSTVFTTVVEALGNHSVIVCRTARFMVIEMSAIIFLVNYLSLLSIFYNKALNMGIQEFGGTIPSK